MTQTFKANPAFILNGNSNTLTSDLIIQNYNISIGMVNIISSKTQNIVFCKLLFGGNKVVLKGLNELHQKIVEYIYNFDYLINRAGTLYSISVKSVSEKNYFCIQTLQPEYINLSRVTDEKFGKKSTFVLLPSIFDLINILKHIMVTWQNVEKKISLVLGYASVGICNDECRITRTTLEKQENTSF